MIGRHGKNHDNILISINKKIKEVRRERLLRAVREGNVKAVTRYVAEYGNNRSEINFYNGEDHYPASMPLMTVSEILAAPDLKNAEPYLQILRVLLGASAINMYPSSNEERSVFDILAPLTSAYGTQAFAILWQHCDSRLKNYYHGRAVHGRGTPLVIASRANAIANVELIMADPEAIVPGRNSNFYYHSGVAHYAIFHSAVNYHPEIFCKMYAGLGIELDLARCRDDKIYFLFALLNDERIPQRLEIAEQIIHKHQFDVNAKDELGRTLLTLAIQKHYPNIIDALLEYKGIDVNARDAAGMTPILHAFSDSLVTAQKLIARNDISDLRATDHKGRSVLTMPDNNTSYTFLEKLMVNKNFDANTPIEGLSPLLYLLKNGCTKAAVTMAGRKDLQDINAVNEAGRTALAEVIVQRYSENYDMRRAAELIFPLLMAMPDIDVSKPDKNGMTPLLYAISEVKLSDTDPFTKELLRRKDLSELNARDRFGRTALYIAIGNRAELRRESNAVYRNNAVYAVYELLSRNDIDINLADYTGTTPLLLAALLGEEDVAHTLLGRKEIDNLNARDTLGRTALYCSIERKFANLAEKLIARDDVDVSADSRNGITPLLLALTIRLPDIAMEILARKDVQAVHAVDSVGRSALYCAAANNNLDVVNALLLRDDVDINLADKYGITPLHAAIMNGNTNIALKLIAKMDAAGINAKDKDGYSALISAIIRENIEVIDALLARKDVDINAVTNSLTTPLMFALSVGLVSVVNKLLSRQEIYVADVTTHGESAISAAVQQGPAMLDILKNLLQRPEVDIDVLNAKDTRGWTSLMWAINNSFIEAAESLLATGKVDANVVSNDDQSALKIAAAKNNIKMLNLLLDHGAKVDQADRQGDTLLLYGVRNNNRAIVRVALDHGASLSHKNLQGDNALLEALKTGNTMMLTYLLERMTAVSQSDVDVNEVFLEAVKRDDAGSLTQLLDRIMKTPEMQDIINETFITAVTRNNKAMVDIIYKYGVDLNYTCKSTGLTALETALHLKLKHMADKLFKLENDVKASAVIQPSLLGKFGLLSVKEVPADVETPQSPERRCLN